VSIQNALKISHSSKNIVFSLIMIEYRTILLLIKTLEKIFSYGFCTCQYIIVSFIPIFLFTHFFYVEKKLRIFLPDWLYLFNQIGL
jgi:hypothetical protein